MTSIDMALMNIKTEAGYLAAFVEIYGEKSIGLAIAHHTRTATAGARVGADLPDKFGGDAGIRTLDTLSGMTI